MELQEAVLAGNKTLFLEIYKRNPLEIKRILHNQAIGYSVDTHLHVAALHGHLSLVEEILGLCPELVESLDSSRSSPLHLAAAKGYLEIVKMLLKTKNENMRNGLNDMGLSPAHLAVIKGRVEVVRELVRGTGAQVRTDQEETVLHLCVKHCQLEILKMLMENVFEVEELVNAKDGYGNTILHLAVSEKHTKIVKYLLSTGKVDVNAKNAMGYTPLDILAQSKRGVQDWAIGNYLQEAGALKTTNFFTPQPNTMQISHKGNNPQIPSFLRQNQNSGIKLNQNEWLAKKRDALMVVASLLAAMAFQVGASPPGGVWQEDTTMHRAGEAVVAYNYPESYKFYIRANTISFVASLSTILLLISGLPFKTRTFMWLLMAIMWLSISSMAFTYGYAIVAVTPRKDRTALRRTLYVAIPVWCGVMALLFLGHTIRLVQRWLRKKGIDMWDYISNLSSFTPVKNTNGVPSGSGV